MSKNEIYEFIEKIKKDYPEFELSESEFEAWTIELENINLQFANKLYEEYKANPEFKDYEPSIRLFTRKRIDEKNKYLIKCQFCETILSKEKMDLHENRHRSVRYIKKKALELFDRNISKKSELELLEMDQNEFDSKYNEFLKKILHKTKIESEIKNIQNILYLNEHLGEYRGTNYENE